MKTFKKLREEISSNVGDGNIAGVGVGPDGEPGVSKKKQKEIQKKNSVLRRGMNGTERTKSTKTSS